MWPCAFYKMLSYKNPSRCIAPTAHTNSLQLRGETSPAKAHGRWEAGVGWEPWSEIIVLLPTPLPQTRCALSCLAGHSPF